jgi:lipoyl(octanoyl) transferase
VRWLGRVPYRRAVELQDSLVAARREGRVPDTLLLLEHPPVITVGRGGDPRHLLADERALERRGIELHRCGRGGDVTFHGPGQLVGYPILALEETRRDAHRYLRDIEEALIRTVAEFDVRAGRADGLTGIWVGREKIAAIGVRLSTGWVTSHGFALNVDADLAGFSLIVPCGIRDRGVTSLARQTGSAPEIREVAARAAAHLAGVLGRQAVCAADPSERLAVPVVPAARPRRHAPPGATPW